MSLKDATRVKLNLLSVSYMRWFAQWTVDVRPATSFNRFVFLASPFSPRSKDESARKGKQRSNFSSVLSGDVKTCIITPSENVKGHASHQRVQRSERNMSWNCHEKVYNVPLAQCMKVPVYRPKLYSMAYFSFDVMQLWAHLSFPRGILVHHFLRGDKKKFLVFTSNQIRTRQNQCLH